jgi:hypothetical protein
VLSQHEVPHNSSMLHNARPFAPADTGNWSAVLARSGHVSIFLTENLPTCRESSSSRYHYGQVDRENLSISVYFCGKGILKANEGGPPLVLAPWPLISTLSPTGRDKARAA